MSLKARLARLEAARNNHAVFVVHGLSTEEHDARIAELIDAGRASEHSLFVCIRKPGGQYVSAQAT